MPAKNHVKPAESNADSGHKEPANIVEWGEFYSHLQDGYRNAQETIRAMDTKVSILTGLSFFAFTAVGGVIGATASWFAEHPEYLRAAATAPAFLLCTASLLALSAVSSIVLGMICILACLDTLRARNRIDGSTGLPATILFPYLPLRGELTIAPWAREHRPAKDYYDRIVHRKFTIDDIQREYHDQILNVAAILGDKVEHFQRACRCFKLQIISTGVVLMIFLLTMIGIVIAHHSVADAQCGTAQKKSAQAPDKPIPLHVP